MVDSLEDCVYIFEGYDDGLEYFECTVHNYLSIGDDWPCEGWANAAGRVRRDDWEGREIGRIEDE